ncbi:uncharacterized protein EDB91DRAFT_1246692 [Suillus paluster]|uniref:uncharacterized protein n=1 Tax=Suillus paluster TaxID=48578 RepID=UPI001B8802F7|nr:uncharacterized protein EDB91DRAFT_1246692 [Suillus paluster]KAG1744572.1 hypothetical protein EDB91DRAFT_1246692 [Suillus paluster]
MAHCAVLESLTVAILHKETVDELSLLSDAIRSCKHHVALRCPSLNLAAWEHLSDLPTLPNVVIYGLGGEVKVLSPSGWHKFNFALFLNIKVLWFRYECDVITVMRDSEFPSLQGAKKSALFIISKPNL